MSLYEAIHIMLNRYSPSFIADSSSALLQPKPQCISQFACSRGHTLSQYLRLHDTGFGEQLSGGQNLLNTRPPG